MLAWNIHITSTWGLQLARPVSIRLAAMDHSSQIRLEFYICFVVAYALHRSCLQPRSQAFSCRTILPFRTIRKLATTSPFAKARRGAHPHPCMLKVIGWQDLNCEMLVTNINFSREHRPCFYPRLFITRCKNRYVHCLIFILWSVLNRMCKSCTLNLWKCSPYTEIWVIPVLQC
jgi:hypothetical protein